MDKFVATFGNDGEVWGTFDGIININEGGVGNVGGGVSNRGSVVDGVKCVGSFGTVFEVGWAELVEVLEVYFSNTKGSRGSECAGPGCSEGRPPRDGFIVFVCEQGSATEAGVVDDFRLEGCMWEFCSLREARVGFVIFPKERVNG